ncbi:tRNA (adenosine(37)-N6)-dimethylallyltransferase MiaA [Hahella ganghwensis]|uniref:tRNA (adenosine(37)-N6)-dimethylallyltransferase MiaA n=1 Tax=Hahella ganghwensis TaxID=286420 RepID=UPI000379456F|nr:tRNA (adenosine(37)-N6)-dimethylallyltransferase MiaA [Hahella ganghwensis]
MSPSLISSESVLTSATSVIVLGATATGKTRLAVELARRLSGEVVSVDSRQVYRGLDIGSGKDLQEYGDTPYHLIDIVEPTTEFSLFDFLCAARQTLNDLSKRRKLPIFSGGTGLFLDALIRGYALQSAPRNEGLRAELSELTQTQLNARLESLKPLHNTTDTQDRERTIRAIEIAEAEARGETDVIQVDLNPVIVGLRCESEVLRNRIEKRLAARLDEGMVDEVRGLLECGVSHQQLYNFGLEYRFVSDYLKGELNFNDMKQKLASAIYQFARQQIKWFRRMERRGTSIQWFESGQVDTETVVNVVSRQLSLPG